jgi:hypothetical protein
VRRETRKNFGPAHQNRSSGSDGAAVVSVANSVEDLKKDFAVLKKKKS